MAVTMAMVAVVFVPTAVVVVAKVLAVVFAVAGTFVVPTGGIGVATCLRLVLRHAAAHTGTRRTAQASAHDRTTAAAHGLANCGTRCTANCAADHRATAAGTMRGDCGACSTTQRATDHCTAFAAHGLAQHRTGCCTGTPTQKRGPVIRMGAVYQGQ